MIFASVIRSLLFLMEKSETVGTATPLNERPEAAKSFACPKRAQTHEWG